MSLASPRLHSRAGSPPLQQTSAAMANPNLGAEAAISFWKRGSLRSGSSIGSSRSNAGVSGSPSVATGLRNATAWQAGQPPAGKLLLQRGAPSTGESSLVNVEMERSGSPMHSEKNF